MRPGDEVERLLGNVRATTYYHFDAVGSTKAATDSMEDVTDTWVYDAWGNTISRTGSTLIFLGYVGELGYYTDSETGLLYIRRRTFAPPTGRWTSEDPLPGLRTCLQIA